MAEFAGAEWMGSVLFDKPERKLLSVLAIKATANSWVFGALGNHQPQASSETRNCLVPGLLVLACQR